MNPAGENDPRWNALLSRNPNPGHPFVYAVATTGVYCRPGCGSRLPRRENVVFFDTPAAAEHAGFRPCKRCAPAQPDRVTRPVALAVRACRLIDAAEARPTLAALAAALDVSSGHLHKVFKAALGITPRDYAAGRRAERLREHLARGETVTRAGYAAGFGSSSRLYERSKKVLGMAPATYARGGAGRAIRYGVTTCSLGCVLVAATEVGVCAVQLGDSPEDLARDLHRRFPRAQVAGSDPAFAELVARVVACVEEPRYACDLPLDVRGTAFQERVWQALGEIPAGRTDTYGAVAARLGKPSAARAVARACAANPAAVVIPCHRVVPASGGLAGYRWGVERKRELLRREAKD